ncbi:MAG: T9SS type A sorting domain-containing protein [Bdellovibrionota bacterium]
MTYVDFSPIEVEDACEDGWIGFEHQYTCAPAQDWHLTIIGNPVRDPSSIHVQIVSPKKEAIAFQLIMYNMMGQIVHQEKQMTPSDSQVYDLWIEKPSLAKGQYILTLHSQDGKTTRTHLWIR